MEGDPSVAVSAWTCRGASARHSSARSVLLDLWGGGGQSCVEGAGDRGLYIGGGIAPKILPKLQDGTFLRAFADKTRSTPCPLQPSAPSATMGGSEPALRRD
ncbi:MAG: glucokinase [Kofleriaceae bacterium]|nr:glucokinase [Candidatus Methylomirabilis lanthanidiphila]